MRLLSLSVICLGLVGSVPADGQALSSNMRVGAFQPRSSIAASAPIIGAARLRRVFSIAPGATAHAVSAPSRALPRGVIGATIGAIAGGAIGYLRVQMYCDGADRCDATRSTVTGAVIGAALGSLLEYAVRVHH